MFNIFLALRCWAKFWAHAAVIIHCDNMADVRVVQSGKSRDEFLSACLRNVWLILAVFDIDLQITHIQGANNTIVHALSRLYSEEPPNFAIIQNIRTKCTWDVIPLQFF